MFVLLNNNHFKLISRDQTELKMLRPSNHIKLEMKNKILNNKGRDCKEKKWLILTDRRDVGIIQVDVKYRQSPSYQ